MNKFIGLSGLPRSGSTLLSAILSQNPDIHAEGNSAVCQLMWDMQQSCRGESYEQLLANDRLQTGVDLVAAIPHIYYKNVTAPIIVDKCRSWTLETNMNLIRLLITDTPKVIVLERPLIDIVKSFVALRIANKSINIFEDLLLDEGTEPIYQFCEIEAFEHDLSNIVNQHPENDKVYNMKGQHDIRATISKRTINVELSDKLLARCAELDK